MNWLTGVLSPLCIQHNTISMYIINIEILLKDLCSSYERRILSYLFARLTSLSSLFAFLCIAF